MPSIFDILYAEFVLKIIEIVFEMSSSPSLLEKVNSLERLALSLVSAIREIKEELKPEEVTGIGSKMQL